MLTQLEIRNLATIREARIEFSPGLNIISGMSGAGKTVLLRALELACGGRFAQKLIAEGGDFTEVAAVFTAPPPVVEKWRDALGLEGGDILVRRRFHRDGRNVSSVNGRLSSAAELQRLGSDLASILSQDESLGLRDPEYRMRLLDTYAGLEAEVGEYGRIFMRRAGVQAELAELAGKSEARDKEREFLEFQHAELSRLALREGEEAELSRRHATLAHAEELKAACEDMAGAADAFSTKLRGGLDCLRNFAGDGGELSRLAQEGASLLAGVEEWRRAICSEGGRLESDPARLAESDERLRLIRGALHKYRRTEAGLLGYFREICEKLSAPPLEFSLKKLHDELAVLDSGCRQRAAVLHEKRLKKAFALKKRINGMLEKLEMPGGRFDLAVELEKEGEPGPRGLDRVEFLLSASPGAQLLPLGSTASGGERSRALLAICTALAGHLDTPVMVFDEIDTSIGSRLGKPVAEAFLELARGRQVICVTHLAPVAASGEAHLMVEKDASGTRVRRLEQSERAGELAHMIAGEKDSRTAIDQAEHMLKSFRTRKNARGGKG